jgi:hypothetical protein
MGWDRIRRNGVYAPLSSRYYMDDAIDQAGPDAELLFLRGLAFSSAAIADGFISARQVIRAVGIGLPDAEESAKTLAEVGLWIPDDSRCGYTIRSWLKWNRSRAEIEALAARDAARKRDVRAESGRTPLGVRSESAPRSDTDQIRSDQINVRPDPSGPGADVAREGARADPAAADAGRRPVPPPPVVAEMRRALAAKRGRRGVVGRADVEDANRPEEGQVAP